MPYCVSVVRDYADTVAVKPTTKLTRVGVVIDFTETVSANILVKTNKFSKTVFASS